MFLTTDAGGEEEGKEADRGGEGRRGEVTDRRGEGWGRQKAM